MRVALSSARLAMLSAILLLTGIAAITFSAFVLLSGHERVNREQQAVQQAGLLAGQVHSFIKQHQLLAQRIAAHVAETGLLHDKKASDRTQLLSQLSIAMPGALRVRTLPPGVREPDGQTPELSYVCFDQIERLSRSEKNVSAELHLAGSPSAHIDIPAIVIDPNNKSGVLGHVLLSINPAAIRQIFDSFRGEHGYMELRQAAGNDGLVLASAGDSSHRRGDPSSQTPIADTAWRLSYWQPATPWSPGTTELAMIGGAALLGLLALISAIVLPRRWLATTLREDANTFSAFFNDVRTGILMGSYSFRLREFNALAKQLRNSGEAIIQDRRKLEERSQTDPLTGVSTRPHFEQKLEQLLQQARLGLNSVLLLTDIDHLDVVSRKIGPEAGDVLLKQFAHQLRKTLRVSDLIARIDHGRFAVLFPHTELEHVQPVVDRLREQLKEESDPGSGMPKTISWSAGLTTTSKDDADINVILARVDSGLKAAQQDGGNKTITHMPSA